jgi:hypothetical protein
LSKIDSVLLEAGECKDVVDAAGAKRSRAADISERRDDVRAAIRVLRRRIVGRLVVREYELRCQRLLPGEEIACECDGEIECRAGDRCATLDRLIEMGEGAQVKRRANAEWSRRRRRHTQLQANDVVFIDSNHVVRSGSEVNYIVLEILPILAKGVLVQFHDIYLPYDYDRDVLRNFTHPNETALVAAFLACNTRYKILFALSMLHYERRQQMQGVLPEYQPESDWRGMRVGEYDQTKHFPSSLWLRVEG